VPWEGRSAVRESAGWFSFLLSTLHCSVCDGFPCQEKPSHTSEPGRFPAWQFHWVLL